MAAAALREASRIIGRSRLDRIPLEPLPPECRPRSQAEGYALQYAVHARLARAGLGEPVGYKIGCTTAVMQRFLGIDHPCAGGVLEGGVFVGAAALRYRDFVKPGVEAEIAVRMRRDLPAAAVPYDKEAVAAAVGEVMAAIEVVDNRYQDFRALGVATLIADDFFHGACILGEARPVADPSELATASGIMLLDGSEVASGSGADVMGHPFEAVAWLANTLGGQGRYLRAGEIILTGSMVATRWLEPGDEVEVGVTVEGLGSVAVRFR